MAKSVLPRHIALRICKTLYELKGGDLHWVDLREVCSRLDEVHDKAMNAGWNMAASTSCCPAVHSRSTA